MLTARQFRAWMRWMNSEWNRPSRSDFYAMQIACEVRRVLMQHPERVDIKDFKLKFATGERKKQPLYVSKAYWFNLTGYKRGERDGAGADGDKASG